MPGIDDGIDLCQHLFRLFLLEGLIDLNEEAVHVIYDRLLCVHVDGNIESSRKQVHEGVDLFWKERDQL